MSTNSLQHWFGCPNLLVDHLHESRELLVVSAANHHRRAVATHTDSHADADDDRSLGFCFRLFDDLTDNALFDLLHKLLVILIGLRDGHRTGKDSEVRREASKPYRGSLSFLLPLDPV